MIKIDSVVRAKILSEALPYMQTYNSKFIVIKYGGHAMVNDNLSDKFAQNIALCATTYLRKAKLILTVRVDQIFWS